MVVMEASKAYSDMLDDCGISYGYTMMSLSYNCLGFKKNELDIVVLETFVN